MTSQCSKKLSWWSWTFCKFSPSALNLQKFFSTPRTFFSHSKTAQILKQNTISCEYIVQNLILNSFFVCNHQTVNDVRCAGYTNFDMRQFSALLDLLFVPLSAFVFCIEEGAFHIHLLRQHIFGFFFTHQPNSALNTVLSVRKNCHFLNPPSPFADVIYEWSPIRPWW